MDKKIDRFDDKDFSQGENLEQYLDLDIRTPITEEAKKISKNTFHTRGLDAPPEIDDQHCKNYKLSCCKLATHDWIEELAIAPTCKEFPICEVRFKNSHKDFFILPEEGEYKTGDIVAVESTTGHDIGIVSLTGLNVKKQ
jgi:hypothetical protein